VTLSGSAVGAAVSGCGGGENAGATATQETLRHAPTPRAAKQRVPPSLGEVESSAEDIVDFARQGERAKAVAAARELRRAAEGTAASDLTKAGVEDARIAALQARARVVASVAPRADLLRIALAANQVSALMPDLYARYSDPVPPAVLELDYLDREAQLRSLARDRTAVATAVSALSSTWAGLRPRVIDAGGAEVAARYAHHVAAMRRLARGSGERALQREAVNGLALVDRLEQVFRRQ
jgi:hypothetical protein